MPIIQIGIRASIIPKTISRVRRPFWGHWILLIAVLLILHGNFRTPAQAQQQSLPIATIIAQHGLVQANNYDGTVRSLSLGARLYVGERVITGADGRLTLDLIDGGRLQLGAQTDLILAYFDQNTIADSVGARLILEHGIMALNSGRLGPRLYIETSTATLRIFQGEIWVLQSEVNEVQIVLRQGGWAEISSLSGKQRLTKLDTVSIAKQGLPPTIPIFLPIPLLQAGQSLLE